MKIAVLTSSRADYGIYLPLLKKLEADDFFELEIIAFGTHLSTFHGYTLQQIRQDGFNVTHKLETLILGDSEIAIANAIGNTITRFSGLWEGLREKINLVLALGDRYEMFAAVAASTPFNIPIAHFHGGETTLGAIDNKFRHAISQMSTLHFTSTEAYANRVSAMIGDTANVFNVGALSLDNLMDFSLLSLEAFQQQFNIDLRFPTILTTFHPETVDIEKNVVYAQKLVEVFEQLATRYQVVITMPNADTLGGAIREVFKKIIGTNDKVIGVENFGTLGYFSCIKHCRFLLGNTSSGIIEAASFGKFVINIGNRQKGRARSRNIFDVPIEREAILNAVAMIEDHNYKFDGKNAYFQKNSSQKVVNLLKAFYVNQ
ncbi:MAG: UDP-N-acetylglucosamine 2-epimerase [Bacteroidota bacterium]